MRLGGAKIARAVAEMHNGQRRRWVKGKHSFRNFWFCHSKWFCTGLAREFMGQKLWFRMSERVIVQAKTPGQGGNKQESSHRVERREFRATIYFN